MEIQERPTETLLSITPTAAAKIRELMAEEPDGDTMVLRVAIQGGGCSGFQYGLGFDTEPAEGDRELMLEGVNVVVDPFSVPYLQGATIDFLTGLQESGLQDRQPERRLLVRLRALLPGGRGRRGREPPRMPTPAAAAPAARTEPSPFATRRRSSRALVIVRATS